MPSNSDLTSLVNTLVESELRRVTVESVEETGLEEQNAYTVTLADKEEPVFVELIPENEAFPVSPCAEAMIGRRTNVPVDQILAGGEVEDNGTTYSFYISRLTSGDPLEDFSTLDVDVQKQILTQLGEYVGQIHSQFEFDTYGELTGDRSLTMGQNGTRDATEYYRDEIEAAFDVAPTSLQHFEDDVLEFFEENKDTLETTSSTLTHPYLDAHNIVVDGEYNIVALDGWDFAEAALADQNIVQLQVLLVEQNTTTDANRQELRNAFYMGYQRENALSSNFGEATDLYRLLGLTKLLLTVPDEDIDTDWLDAELNDLLTTEEEEELDELFGDDEESEDETEDDDLDVEAETETETEDDEDEEEDEFDTGIDDDEIFGDEGEPDDDDLDDLFGETEETDVDDEEEDIFGEPDEDDEESEDETEDVTDVEQDDDLDVEAETETETEDDEVGDSDDEDEETDEDDESFTDFGEGDSDPIPSFGEDEPFSQDEEESADDEDEESDDEAETDEEEDAETVDDDDFDDALTEMSNSDTDDEESEEDEASEETDDEESADDDDDEESVDETDDDDEEEDGWGEDEWEQEVVDTEPEDPLVDEEEVDEDELDAAAEEAEESIEDEDDDGWGDLSDDDWDLDGLDDTTGDEDEEDTTEEESEDESDDEESEEEGDDFDEVPSSGDVDEPVDALLGNDDDDEDDDDEDDDPFADV